MDFETLPASNYSLPDLVQILNRGFEAYFVPIQFNTDTFLNMLRKDGTDLTASQVLRVDGEPCGIALIARRGWASRLAAMGIAREMRGKGVGSWFMGELIRQARQRGEREMVLEVIEQNEAAVKLYQKVGFGIVRRLVGLIRKNVSENGTQELNEMDLRELGRLVSQQGLQDLPWQLSGESIAQMNPPACAFCAGPAYLAISDPRAEQVAIWSLLVEPGARRQGHATELLRSVIGRYPGKTWHVPAIFPEEMAKVFERSAFQREELSQWQMRLRL